MISKSEAIVKFYLGAALSSIFESLAGIVLNYAEKLLIPIILNCSRGKDHQTEEQISCLLP
jgi:hypothetical protein